MTDGVPDQEDSHSYGVILVDLLVLGLEFMEDGQNPDAEDDGINRAAHAGNKVED